MKTFFLLVVGVGVCCATWVSALHSQTKPVLVQIEWTAENPEPDVGLIKVHRINFSSKRTQIFPENGVWRVSGKSVESLAFEIPSHLVSGIKEIKINVGKEKRVLSGPETVNSAGPGVTEGFSAVSVPIQNPNFQNFLLTLAVSIVLFLSVFFVLQRAGLPFAGLARFQVLIALALFFQALSAVLSVREFSVLSVVTASVSFSFVFSLLADLLPQFKGFRSMSPAGNSRVFPLIVAISFFLLLRGIEWGIAESWNPDNMTWVNVTNFDRPHLVSLLHLFFAKIPVFVADALFNLSSPEANKVSLLLSRLINLVMFLACGGFVYIWAKAMGKDGEDWNLPAALASGVFLLSPGYGAFSKFLTADVPLMFFMFIAFHFCLRIAEKSKTHDYLTAGLLTGVAVAAKYYGLAVGISIVAAHFFSCYEKGLSFKNTALSRPFFLGLCCVPLGFFLGDPLALTNFKELVSDFYSNYTVVPIYGGNVAGNSFGGIVLSSLELFAPPKAALVFLSYLFALYMVFKGKLSRSACALFFVSTAVFAVYFVKFATFPRSEVRFSLPFFALLVPICAIFFKSVGRKPAIVLATILFTHSSMCLWIVGDRLKSDPRMEAIQWFQTQCDKGCIVENNEYSSPNWRKIIGDPYKVYYTPRIKNNIAATLPFVDKNSAVFDVLEKVVREDKKKFSFFTSSDLARRNPDFIALNSIEVGRYSQHKMFAQINSYFTSLLEERFNYRIVFDAKTRAFPVWAYPKRIDFLGDRMVILKRKQF